MKLRPQVQFRFRDVKQFENVKLFARKAEVSVNEWLLVAVEQRLDGTSGTTTQNPTGKIENLVMPHEASEGKPKHALGCHCYMCRPPRDK